MGRIKQEIWVVRAEMANQGEQRASACREVVAFLTLCGSWPAVVRSVTCPDSSHQAERHAARSIRLISQAVLRACVRS